jgi:ADP-ribose pyrophosphatase
MTPSNVEVIKKNTPYNGYLQVDHYLLKHALFEGGWSDVMSREVIERGHVSAVLLYDPDLDLFVLAEQFRPGAHMAKASPWWDDSFSPWMVECIAGVIDPGETPEDVCQRESIEEANSHITALHPIYHYFSSPGCLTESVFLFCGKVDATNAGGVFGLKHEHENIRVFTVSPNEAFVMLEQGRIVNSKTIIAVQWFQLNGHKLRQKWT